MRVGELARRVGVSADAVRFYEKRGLIRATRGANGYRDFPEAAVAVLRLVRQAQALGFTLSEIGALTGAVQEGMTGDDVAALLRDKIAALDAKAAEIAALRAMLVARLDDVCPLHFDTGAGSGAQPRGRAELGP